LPFCACSPARRREGITEDADFQALAVQLWRQTSERREALAEATEVRAFTNDTIAPIE
jgi:hypothetical protein